MQVYLGLRRSGTAEKQALQTSSGDIPNSMRHSFSMLTKPFETLPQSCPRPPRSPRGSVTEPSQNYKLAHLPSQNSRKTLRNPREPLRNLRAIPDPEPLQKPAEPRGTLDLRLAEP